MAYSMTENLTASEAAMRQGAPGLPVADTAITRAHSALDRSEGLARRVMDLADKVDGPQPTACGTDGAPDGSDGVLGVLRGHCSLVNDRISEANEALDRLERALL